VRIIKSDRRAITAAVSVLKKGGLIIYPTETLYGAGVDATNPSAVKKLSEYKSRPLGKPYSIAVSDKKMAQNYVFLNPTAENLYKKFLPGPLTVISKGKQKVAQGVESESGTLGIRIPDYKLVLDIVGVLGKPITATSANASYKKRPYSVSDVVNNISSRQKALIDLVIDAGTLPRRDPSSVVDTTLDEPVVLRQGAAEIFKKVGVLSRSEEDTMNVAKEIWQKYETHNGSRAIIFALQGEMGAGKTIFTKGLARAMGINELVTSPTFALENEYTGGNTTLHHFDAWRIENPQELLALGLKDLVADRRVVVIEWAERVSDVIHDFDAEAVVIWVNIKYGQAEKERHVDWGVNK